MVKGILEAMNLCKRIKFLQKKEEWMWISGFKGAEKYLEGCHVYNNKMIDKEDYRIYTSLNSAYNHCDPIINDMGCFVVKALVRKADWEKIQRNKKVKREISYIAKEIFFEYTVAYDDRWKNEWIKTSKYCSLSKEILIKLSDSEFAKGFLN